MPYGHPGFDFIWNRDKKVDVKASCLHTRDYQNRSAHWAFNVNSNDIADYFLCIAFDDREHLNPMYLWLIPRSVLKQLNRIYISTTTINKWNKYQLNIDEVTKVCNTIKGNIGCGFNLVTAVPFESETTVPIACKTPAKDVEEIDTMVVNGEYLNRSDFLRTAVRKLLAEHT